MPLSDEIERLGELRRRGLLSAAEFTRAKEKLLAPAGFRGARRQSTTRLFGLPLWAVASGPDPAKGETIGHAKAIFAFGDMATGLVAMGGFARGLVALGGLSLGMFSAGGLAIGIALALGGGAVGGLAFGGGAIGAVAVGGGAVGYYAMGGGAVGSHVIAAGRCDPPALDFFSRHASWLPPVRDLLAGQGRGLRPPLCPPAR